MSSASAPLPLASTPKCSIPVSPVANWTIPSSAIFRPAPIPAAKTASSTPSSSMAPFFNLPSPFEREKLSTAMASYSAIYCRKWRKHQNERRNLSKRKSALSHFASARSNYSRRRPAHRSAPVEFHPSRRHGALLRRTPQGPPTRLPLSAPRALRRRLLHRPIQNNPHHLRQFPHQRCHRPLAARPPHRRTYQPRHAPRRHPVFPRIQFCRLAIHEHLSS